MAEDTGYSVVWHPETIEHGAVETLRALRDQSLIGDAYLAGGTALALHFGHRISVDLDFFVPAFFEEDQPLARLKALTGFSLAAKAPSTIHAAMQGTKLSFLGYPYPALFPMARFEGVPVADPRDIACMKVSAIASRGAKRDFFDLYVASERFGLGNILN
ncbi:MAG TPA: nucleotidyl transferase AbiEii/AbiGii toxin family protein [Bryobacteraceae bacterium]|jgi:predicted nucleotidyltransferase component of viral defense system|nr:nucleotidyl transferase AbiEii/AbiGii toxin family protein [Bryobacteraceae bacterium]